MAYSRKIEKDLAFTTNSLIIPQVLDIGETYTWKVIEWQVREIEKPGSWHTTVGHGDSMRYRSVFSPAKLIGDQFMK